MKNKTKGQLLNEVGKLNGKIAELENLHSIIENTSDHISVISKDMKIQFINKTVPDLKKEDVIGKSVNDFIPKDFQKLAYDKFQSVFKIGKPSNYQTEYLTADGETHYFDVRLSPIKKGGKVVSIVSSSNNITERKQAEEKLQVCRKRLLKIQEIAQVGFLEWNLETNKIFLSDRVVDLYKLESGKNWFTPEFVEATIHPDDLERAKKNLESLAEGKTPHNIDHRVIRTDGEIIWVHAQYEIIYDSAGKSENLLGTIIDITERKQANEELRKSEARLSKAQEIANIGSWEMDIKTEESVWSDQTYRLFGLEPKESKMTFERFKDFLFPEDQESVLREVGEAMANKDSYEGEYRIVRRDNEVRFMHSIAKIEHDESGKPVLIRGTIQDITDQKNMEEVLKKSEKRLQTSTDIVYSIPHGIFIYQYEKPDKLILLNGNPEAERLTGINVDDWIGKENNEIWPEARKIGITDAYLKVMKTGKTYKTDDIYYKDIKLEGAFSIRAFILPKERLCVSFENITKRKQIEEEQKHTLVQLRKLSSRLESIREEEAGRISRELHDEMGQYLTAINLNLQQLAKKFKKGNKKSIDELLKNTSEIVNETEEKVRELSLELRPLMLEELGLVSTFHWYIDKTFLHLKINCDFVSTNIKKRLSDNLKIAFFRVMQETITNVLRHAEATNVEINLKQTDKDVIYTIWDDGKGFDVQKYGKTIKPSHGLGLVGIKERVQYLGGMVTIESEPKKGTTVMVLIPLKEGIAYD